MWPPPESVYWFERAPVPARPQLTGRVAADVAIVGGGIAGLTAARRLAAAGLRVVLVEASSCGRSATGRSSGFITPDSELQLADLCRRFGDDRAESIYRHVRAACNEIRKVADAALGPCDLVRADSLWAASDMLSARLIRAEHDARTRLGFDSTLLEGSAARATLGTSDFPAAVRYGDTFGVNGAGLALALRELALSEGVRVYENSPALEIGPGFVRTPRGRVTAGRIIACLDRFAPDADLAVSTLYRARAYLLLTEPLPDETRSRCFPTGPLMVWDTDLIYHYFRPTRDGRLLIGGGTLASVYAKRSPPSEPVHAELAAYIRRLFPFLSGIRFTHRWEGLIGTTKDILPLAGPAPDVPGVHIALGGAGIPWSALAAQVACDTALGIEHPLAGLLDPARPFTTIDPLQPVLGRRATWMVANELARRYETGGASRIAARRESLKAGLAAGAASLLAAALLSRLRPRR